MIFDPYGLRIQSTIDPLNNETLAVNDYRVLQPVQITDPNGNHSFAALDALGMVVGTAVQSKEGEGDSLEDFEPDLPLQKVRECLDDPLHLSAAVDVTLPNSEHDPHDVLRKASTRIIYDLFAVMDDRSPTVAYTMSRENHYKMKTNNTLQEQPITRIQHAFLYSDGFSRELQTKVRAEPGPIYAADGQVIVNNAFPRWVATGTKVYNNKGKPVRAFEPFFSAAHSQGIEQYGVSPTLFYDPLERLVATLHPNHTYEKEVFDPWRQEFWDANDTIHPDHQWDPQTPNDLPDPTFNPEDDTDVGQFFQALLGEDYLPTWYNLRMDPAKVVEKWPDDTERRTSEKVAAQKAAKHASTPAVAHLDVLGRTFLTVADNHPEGQYQTHIELDIEGNQLSVTDAKYRIVMRYDHDILGNRIYQASMEAGERRMLNDVAGKPIRAWDSRNHAFRTEYDPLRRPLRAFVTGADTTNPNQELLTELLVYGEQHLQGELRNLRGKLYLHFDQAGVVANEAHDFKGNLLRASRRLAREYRKAVDWSAVDAALPANPTTKLDPAVLEAALAPRLEAETFTNRTTYDALDRPIQLIAPHNDQPGKKVNVVQPIYNEANLLEQVHVWLNQSNEPSDGLDPATANHHVVTNIDYNPKGQRKLVEYGNGVRTTYEYDTQTFRLIRLLTKRNPSAFPNDCTIPPASGCEVQNLHYTYDPTGNITHIRDDAQQTIYFKNKRVDPSAEYTHDAIYRLIEATGREHLGQTGGQPNPPTPSDEFNRFHIRLDHRGDGKAMGRYIDAYVYDAAGNILSMQHRGTDPAHPGWTRAYAYNEASLLEATKLSNRLSSTTIGTTTETYLYDSPAGLHGNITAMPHLSSMQWDYRDQLRATARQVVNSTDTPETTYYVYDAGGQRVRKVTQREAAAEQTPTRKAERIYLGGLEIYREYNSDGTTVTLARETLHLMDDKKRIALVENRTQGTDGSPPQLVRFQYGNHLGSACLELDDQAQIISYEEYYPYGSTSYQAVRSQTETPKRYRYSGKELDDETGLSYYGARYYAPWLGRWMSCDPLGPVDGPNLYQFLGSRPITYVDRDGTSGEEHSAGLTKKLGQWINQLTEGPLQRVDRQVSQLEEIERQIGNERKQLQKKSEKLESASNRQRNADELYLKVVFKGKGGVSTGRLLAAVNRPH